MTAASALVHAYRGVRWYVREVTGESAYDRYVEERCRNHPDEVVLDRRSFERHRQDLAGQEPQQRCC